MSAEALHSMAAEHSVVPVLAVIVWSAATRARPVMLRRVVEGAWDETTVVLTACRFAARRSA